MYHVIISTLLCCTREQRRLKLLEFHISGFKLPAFSRMTEGSLPASLPQVMMPLYDGVLDNLTGGQYLSAYCSNKLYLGFWTVLKCFPCVTLIAELLKGTFLLRVMFY